MHIISEYSEEGGWTPDRTIPLVGKCAEKLNAVAFNNADLATNSRYNDCGVRYSYRLVKGEVYVTIEDQLERLVQHTSDCESRFYCDDDRTPSPVGDERGQTGIHFVETRVGQILKKLTFDLIAASGNRVFVRESGTANFYFASMKHEFVNGTLPELATGSDDRDHPDGDCGILAKEIPGVYATLDAEHGLRLNDFACNPALSERYGAHPSLKSFSFLNGEWRGVAGLALEGLRIAKVYPEVWHRLDTRPPYGSGSPPWFVETFNHITYEGLLETRSYSSIKIYGVLDIGVGHTHRVLHHESKYGNEVDTMNHLAFPSLAGPVEDAGGFCDGMCNFYVLCKIKIRNSPDDTFDKDALAILWIDEQTYFCERWRLVGFEDTDQNTLRAWGIAAVYSSHNVPHQSYWSPFEASWWSNDRYVDERSRMAVAKHTLVVTGQGPAPHPHPDNSDEASMLGSEQSAPFTPLLYTTNYSFATSDRTWRWRGYPCAPSSGCNWTDDSSGPTCFPETIRIREDMTIHMKGINKDGQRGYWYQKVLPADNTPVPYKDALSQGFPSQGYIHAWNFATTDAFIAKDRYHHFGVHTKEADSRSQYYLLDVVDELTLPSNCEDHVWVDVESRFVWRYAGVVNRPISPYNKSVSQEDAAAAPSCFKILDRRPIGIIAVWWDKRDDEIPGIEKEGTSNGPILLAPINDQSRRIATRKFERFTKRKTPVVQCAKVSTVIEDGALVEFRLRYYTRMFADRAFESPTPSEPNDGLDFTPVPEDLTIREYIEKHTPDYIDAEAVLSRWFFKPDTTLFRAFITVEHEAQRDVYVVISLLDERIHDSFSRRSRYEYEHVWQRSSNSSPHPMEALIIKYCGASAEESGTCVWFEDIVGHITTPERTYFMARES